jgi:hypothetical protein
MGLRELLLLGLLEGAAHGQMVVGSRASNVCPMTAIDAARPRLALVNSDEGLVTYPIAGSQPEQRELVFMPVIAKPPAQVLDDAAEL